MDRADVYKVIDGERNYQDATWNENTTASNGVHTPAEFLLIMEHYMSEARRMYCTASEPGATDRMLDRMRCVVGLGIACFEQNGVPVRGEVASFMKHYNKMIEHVRGNPITETPPLIRPEDQT
jgi:hypothetical protein